MSDLVDSVARLKHAITTHIQLCGGLTEELAKSAISLADVIAQTDDYAAKSVDDIAVYLLTVVRLSILNRLEPFTSREFCLQHLAQWSGGDFNDKLLVLAQLQRELSSRLGSDVVDVKSLSGDVL